MCRDRFWEIRNIHNGDSRGSTALCIGNTVNYGMRNWPSFVVGFINNDGTLPEFWGYIEDDVFENDEYGKILPEVSRPRCIGHIAQIIVSRYLVYACVYVPAEEPDDPYEATATIRESDVVRYYALGCLEHSVDENLVYGECAPIEIEASGALESKDLIAYIEAHGVPGEPKDDYSWDADDWWHYFYADCEDRDLFHGNLVWGESWGIRTSGGNEIGGSSVYAMACYIPILG